jgi:hypothetical protein
MMTMVVQLKEDLISVMMKQFIGVFVYYKLEIAVLKFDAWVSDMREM